MANRRPIAVLISDVHYNLQNLKLADAAMRQAITKANSLEVPLIVAGDLHDTKANLRGECVNAMIETFKLCDTKPYILIGNHDKINEKSEWHSLDFLRPYSYVIDAPGKYRDWTLISYQSDATLWQAQAAGSEKIICHQGLLGGYLGDYVKDHSAVANVRGKKVISGHYHARQTIDLPNGGKWDYIGNPYTMSWGEANDPDKGFQVLYDDGSLEFVPTNLRKHAIEEFEVRGRGLDFPCLELLVDSSIRQEDLLWVRIQGDSEGLSKITRGRVASLLGRSVFKLTLHPADLGLQNGQSIKSNSTQPQILDSLIDLTNTTEACKVRLKSLWKGL